MPEEVPCRQVLESLPQRLMSNLLAATVNMAYLTEEVLDSSRRVLFPCSPDAEKGYSPNAACADGGAAQ